jgi:predicted ATPase/tRNA A-37 threonylcarbamoyl transferase component Bud32
MGSDWDERALSATLEADTLDDPGLSDPRAAVLPVGGESIGQRLGRYQLERRLGAGGMGEVFAARTRDGKEYVALKTLAKSHATLRYRFKREFRALADLEHPNLIRLGELVVPPDGIAYFTMELLEGEHFVRWVRATAPAGEPPAFDRLENALRQLVAGVEHLHASKCVHRDLKPSNVMVTTAGRVVILDFGLVSELDGSDGVTQDGQVIGTPAYMAPEQAAGSRVGPAADYYSLGVMLFECLTGKVPFRGPLVQMLTDKQLEVTPVPGSPTAKIPVRLRELCMRLLSRDPGQRPSAREFLALLDGGNRRGTRPDLPEEQLFVGRRAELATLEAALAHVQARHEPVTVHLRGHSGHGKSALIQRFASAAQRDPKLAFLRGRCRERETVPYKGLDAVVDALSAYLRHLPKAELDGLRPRYLAAVVRIFPVLDEIWTRELEQVLGFGPDEMSILGRAGLRDVLSKLASARILIMVIDDFQWSDPDSVALLQTLTRPPDAPAMLLVVSFQAEAAKSELLGGLTASEELESRNVQTIELGPLPEADARELAVLLLRTHADALDEPGTLQARADVVALRSAGSPFYIGQLVHGQDAADSSADLEQVVVHRFAQLDAPARRILEIVAVSGRPLPQALILACCDDANEDRIAQLCEIGLLVRGESDELVVETAHDRIRELVLAELAAEQLSTLHRVIGAWLLECNPDVSRSDEIFAIADHLHAGFETAEALIVDRRRFAAICMEAGARAKVATAFGPAAEHYEHALRLLGDSNDVRAARLDASRELAECRAMAGELEAAEQAYSIARALVTSEVELARLLLSEVTLATVPGDTERALARIMQAAAAFNLDLRQGGSQAWIAGSMGALLAELEALGPETIHTRPLLDDPQQTSIAQMLLASTNAAYMAGDMNLYAALSLAMIRLGLTHGISDITGVALIQLAIVLASGSSDYEGARRYTVAGKAVLERFPESPLWGMFELVRCTTIQPWIEAMALCIPRLALAHVRLRGNGMLTGAGYASYCSVMTSFLIGAPLARVDEDAHIALEYLEDIGDRPMVFTVRAHLGASAVLSGLVALDAEPTLNELEPKCLAELNPTTRFSVHAVRALTCLLMEDDMGVDAAIEAMGPTVSAGAGLYSWITYKVLALVRACAHYPGMDAEARAQHEAAIDQTRVMLERWKASCPDNASTFVHLLAGAWAHARGELELARREYTAAADAASDVGFNNFEGFANERGAAVLLELGEHRYALGYLEHARRSYARWGAGALERRVDAKLRTLGGSPQHAM